MKFLSIFAALAVITLVTACAPAGVWTAGSHNQRYEWTGCRVVTENPAADGSYHFAGPGFDTSRVYFKQLNNDGTMSEPNGVPCE